MYERSVVYGVLIVGEGISGALYVGGATVLSSTLSVAGSSVHSGTTVLGGGNAITSMYHGQFSFISSSSGSCYNNLPGSGVCIVCQSAGVAGFNSPSAKILVNFHVSGNRSKQISLFCATFQNTVVF